MNEASAPRHAQCLSVAEARQMEALKAQVKGDSIQLDSTSWLDSLSLALTGQPLLWLYNHRRWVGHAPDRRRTLHAARHTHVNGKSLDAHSAAHPQLNVIHNFSLAAGDDSSSARLPFWALFGRPKSLKRHARLLYTLDTYMYTNIHVCVCVCLFRHNFVIVAI